MNKVPAEKLLEKICMIRFTRSQWGQVKILAEEENRPTANMMRQLIGEAIEARAQATDAKWLIRGHKSKEAFEAVEAQTNPKEAE